MDLSQVISQDMIIEDSSEILLQLDLLVELSQLVVVLMMTLLQRMHIQVLVQSHLPAPQQQHLFPTGSVLVYSTSVVEMLMHSLSYRLLLVVCLQTELLAKQSPNITTSRLSRRSQQKIMDRSLLLRRRQKIMV